MQTMTTRKNSMSDWLAEYISSLIRRFVSDEAALQLLEEVAKDLRPDAVLAAEQEPEHVVYKLPRRIP